VPGADELNDQSTSFHDALNPRRARGVDSLGVEAAAMSENTNNGRQS